MSRNARFWLLLGAALIIVVMIVGGAGGDGPPLDPRSVNPDGARGVVEVLESLGAEVQLDRSAPLAESTSALLLRDRLSEPDRLDMERWIESGGVLVVADLSSSFAQDWSSRVSRVERDSCNIEALADVNTIELGGSLVEVNGGESCFGDGQRAFVVATQRGRGTIVTVGGVALFTNAELDEGDAAVLAVSLLAPDPKEADVTFVGPSLVEFGEEGIGDLVAPRVRNAILQLLAAFLLFGLFRSRRLGKVVPEPVPVHIEGSELVLKAGLLSQRAQDPTSAAAILRTDFAHRARQAFSIPADADESFIAARLADGVEMSHPDILRALSGPVTTEAHLIAVAQALAQFEHALTDQTPVPSS